MTTIAYKDGIMAADSGVTYDDTYKGSTQKIFFSKKSGVVGMCGSLAYLAKFKKWVEVEHCDLAKIPNTEGDATALWLKTDETVWLIECGLAVQVNAPYYATGSGHALATGAMAAGASAEQAVLVATIHDAHSYAPVQVANLADAKVDVVTPDNVLVFPPK